MHFHFICDTLTNSLSPSAVSESLTSKRMFYIRIIASEWYQCDDYHFNLPSSRWLFLCWFIFGTRSSEQEHNSANFEGNAFESAFATVMSSASIYIYKIWIMFTYFWHDHIRNSNLLASIICFMIYFPCNYDLVHVLDKFILVF